MSAFGAKRTNRECRERADPTKMTQMYGPAVGCKRTSSSWGICGLASMYPAFDWSVFVLRAIMDISARAISLADRPPAAIWVTSARMRREDRSSISFVILSQTSAGKAFQLFALNHAA